MILLKNWLDKFLELSRHSEQIQIVSPYVSYPPVEKLSRIFNIKNLTLITRFNLQDFYSGVSSLECLRKICNEGAEIYGVRGLHSKIYVFDATKAIVSSANLTNGGLMNNYECGFLIEDKSFLSQLQNQIEEFKLIGQELNGISTIDEWQNELNSVVHINVQKTALPDYGGSNIEFDPTRNYYVKFFGTSNERKDFDFVIREEVDRGLSHYATCFSQNKRPRRFRDGDILFYGRLTTPNDYAIFGKAEAIAFNDSRDWATDGEITERPWKEDWPVYLRVQNATFIDGNLGDCPMLYDLINFFDHESFISTQRRYAQGERQINPFKSLSQQPYVALTHTAARWLFERFIDAQNRSGPIPDSFIDSLPRSEIEL